MRSGRRANPFTVPKPWDVVIDGEAAAFTNCVYKRGPVFKPLTDADFAAVSLAAGTTGDWFLYRKVNTQTGVTTVGFSNVTTGDDRYCDTTVPEDAEFERSPLYRLTRAAETDPWYVACDYRDISLVLHV